MGSLGGASTIGQTNFFWEHAWARFAIGQTKIKVLSYANWILGSYAVLAGTKQWQQT